MIFINLPKEVCLPGLDRQYTEEFIASTIAELELGLNAIGFLASPVVESELETTNKIQAYFRITLA